MSFYCLACKERFLLRPNAGESTEDFTARLITTRKANCPKCGKLCKKCKCGDSTNAPKS